MRVAATTMYRALPGSLNPRRIHPMPGRRPSRGAGRTDAYKNPRREPFASESSISRFLIPIVTYSPPYLLNDETLTFRRGDGAHGICESDRRQISDATESCVGTDLDAMVLGDDGRWRRPQGSAVSRRCPVVGETLRGARDGLPVVACQRYLHLAFARFAKVAQAPCSVWRERAKPGLFEGDEYRTAIVAGSAPSRSQLQGCTKRQTRRHRSRFIPRAYFPSWCVRERAVSRGSTCSRVRFHAETADWVPNESPRPVFPSQPIRIVGAIDPRERELRSTLLAGFPRRKSARAHSRNNYYNRRGI